jgi:chromosome segregation ATPase
VIAIEINSIKDQTRKMVLSSSIEIGRRLVEAKGMIDHGQWGQWLEENVDYSQRTANNLMRIFEEYGENQLSMLDNSPKSQALANLSITQAVALLGIAPEEREEFAEANNIEEMSTRELEQAIKEKKAAQDEAAAAVQNAESMEQMKKKAERDLEKVKQDTANEAARISKDLAESRKESKRLEKELAAAKEAGGADTIERLTQELKDANEKAAQLDEDLKEERGKPIVTNTVEVVPEEITRELETLRAKVTSDDSPLMTKFRLQFETLTTNFNQLLQTLTEIKPVDAYIHEKYCGAVGKLVSSMSGKLEAR